MSIDTDPRRPRARQRRENVPGGRQHFHEVGVTAEEESRLLQLSLEQGVSIPRLLIESTLAAAAGESTAERRATLAKLFELHRLLAAVSNNVNQIAKATNATGERQAETNATLSAVRQTAARIDALVDELSLS